MKKKIFSLLCLLSLFLCCGCSCGKSNSIEDMGILELIEYQNGINDDYDYLKSQFDEVYDRVDGKNSLEIINMINTLNNEVVKSNITVINTFNVYDEFGRIETATSLGSSSIIKETNDKYYILTNNHVISTEGYNLASEAKYEAVDYLNNKYPLILEKTDKAYDMAILSFEKKNVNLRVASIANKDAIAKENIISIGQPLGKRNTISFGEVIKYDYVKSNESAIKYPCMFYDAFTNYGNSGGMVINYDFEIVAITTFGISHYNQYECGAGSSASKIREFIELYFGGDFL